jgi:hypothetical protein
VIAFVIVHTVNSIDFSLFLIGAVETGFREEGHEMGLREFKGKTTLLRTLDIMIPDNMFVRKGFGLVVALTRFA